MIRAVFNLKKEPAFLVNMGYVEASTLTLNTEP